jgi:hypothetical protein
MVISRVLPGAGFLFREFNTLFATRKFPVLVPRELRRKWAESSAIFPRNHTPSPNNVSSFAPDRSVMVERAAEGQITRLKL